jgi:hypothetical protein
MSSRKKKFRKKKISNEKIQQLPGLIFVGFIRIYQKILMHFEIDPTISSVRAIARVRVRARVILKGMRAGVRVRVH